MWIELEKTFNINQITSMENNLKSEKLRLLELYQDTQGQAQVRKAQNAALDEKEAVDIKLKGKVNKHSNEIREAKQQVKLEQDMQKKLMDKVKKKHAEIMGLEDKYKRI